ncbi:MAG: RNA methyltransferase [Nitrospiraceae bacterium]
MRALLRDKHARAAEQAFVVEGEKAVLDLLGSSPRSIQAIVASEEWAVKQNTPGDLTAYIGPLSRLEQLSDTPGPQCVLAIAKKPSWDQAALLSRTPHTFVFAEQLQDPANIGALLRVAAAFGVDVVWLSPGSVDPFHPKSVRAAAGAILTIPVFVDTHFEQLQRHGSSLLVADARQTSIPLHAIVDRPQRLTVAIGNEGQGVSANLREAADGSFWIPIHDHVESLNVTSAAAIALYHLTKLQPATLP